MKKIEFKTSKGEFLIADLPTPMSDMYKGGSGTISINRGEEYSLTGPVKELTEEDWKKVVDSEENIINGMTVYKDYNLPDSDLCEWWSHADFSGATLMGNLGVILFNPYGDECPKEPTEDEDDDLGLVATYRWHRAGLWREAEERVYKNPYLFKKINK